MMSGWQGLLEDVLTGMREWRASHPKATFAEIERAVEERVDTLRAQLIQDVVTTSTAAEVASRPVGERPHCPACGELMESRGQQDRVLTVPGDRLVRLRRAYVVCPACGAGLFPPGRGARTSRRESLPATHGKCGAAGDADAIRAGAHDAGLFQSGGD
jgi:YgiT-type zinc finger domain-containing protein